MAAIEQSVVRWKEKLLNLGKRNRLLNYKETKRSNLNITSPEIGELYRLLVIEEKFLKFPLPIIRDEFNSDDDTYDFVEQGDIETDRTLPEQQKSLRNIRAKAKIATDEQGVNVLFLAFGFVHWKESDDSDIWIISPLVLVPVNLTIRNISAPFILSLNEDEIVVNPTLKYKFENNFGLQLPSFDDYEEDIYGYLKNVETMIKNKGWSISQTAGLSLLSFLKINMYRDLEQNSDRINSNSVLRAITGDSSLLPRISEDYKGYDHDKKTNPIDTFQVLDADASQQDAILFSKKGISFVLQGPPGTGKSQTISNIIAEGLADGKKILFVSEKMAALEIVYKRLSQVGLDTFCLTLHSYKAKKKEVLEELRKTLLSKNGANKNNLSNMEDLDKLNNLQRERELLNQYNDQLHSICKPLGITIFQAQGKIAKLYASPDFIFSINNIELTTPEQLNNYQYLLNNFANTIGKMSDDYTLNPWYGCHVPAVTHELRHDIETKFRKLISDLQEMTTFFTDLSRNLNWEIQPSYENLSLWIDALNLLAISPNIPSSWIRRDDLLSLHLLADEFKIKQEKYHELKMNLSQRNSEEYFSIDAHEIIASCRNATEKAFSFINPKTYPSEEILVNNVPHILAKLEKISVSLTDAISTDCKFDNLFGLDPARTIKEIFFHYQIICCLLSNPKPTEFWFEADKLSIIKNLLGKANFVFSQVRYLEANLLKRYHRDILNIDYKAMSVRFKTEYISIFKTINKSYKTDKLIFLGLAVGTNKNIDDSTILGVLDELKAIDDNKVWISENNEKLIMLLGSHYLGDLTDWGAVEKSIINFDQIISVFSTSVMTLQTKNLLLAGLANIPEIIEAKQKIEICLNEHSDEILPQILNLNCNLLDLPCSEIIAICQNAKQLLVELSKKFENMKQFALHQCSYSQAKSDITRLLQVQEISQNIKKQECELADIFESEFLGLNTNWTKIIKNLEWVSKTKNIIDELGISSKVISSICNDEVSVNNIAKICEKIEINRTDIENNCEWVMSLFEDRQTISNLKLSELINRLNKGLNLRSLEEWVDFRFSREKCREAGLGDYCEQIEKQKIPTDTIIPAFLKRFYRLWLDSMMEKHPAIVQFRTRTQEERIKGFVGLDKQQFEIAQRRIRTTLLSKIPDNNRFHNANDELSILERELNKQKRIMPIRKLFQRIPNLLLALKPCLMMSPLSVSLFLEAKSYEFDMVIFDEASQIYTEDAVGAILRGKQIIIAGDNKQLPPTSFFSARTLDSDYDEDDEESNDDFYDIDAYDSILEEALSALPNKSLLWHYRSRHENLIAFSNYKIYNNSLTTFPASIDKVPNNGVEFFYVSDGIYEGGGKNCNAREAQKVVELIKEHIKNYPKRSLGVITFSEKQQQAIDMAVRQFRIQNQQYENFFSEDIDEAFFIKNLENVQGDERDTIIFSIGYAKDSNGKMYMRFGPLSSQGGFRRLNVAVTRAKYNVKLVGSILPTDIDLERTNSDGVKMLRSYIDFAIRGKEAFEELSVPEVIETDSPFEEAVYEFLSQKNYKVATQVGCSGYRIDMAIKHPTLSGRFVLGVECDGASYHSARTARERDRLRQDVLENIGWKIYRIWSTDWIKDPKSEGEKLVEAVEIALSSYIDRVDVVMNNRDEEIPTLITPTMVTKEDLIPIDEVPSTEAFCFENDSPSVYGFEFYQEADIGDCRPHSNKNIHLANAIQYVVNVEYPIHFDTLCKRLAPLFDNQKATSRVRKSVENIINQYLKDELICKDEFWYPKDATLIRVRIAKGDVGYRLIQHFSMDELSEAMYIIVSQTFGITKENLFISTARALGFNRTGEKILNALKFACDNLISCNRVKEVEEKIILADS